MSRIQVKENSKRIWTYPHIPMYMVIGVKPVYVHGYRGKSRIYHLLYSFLGMIKVTSKDKIWSMGYFMRKNYSEDSKFEDVLEHLDGMLHKL